MAILGVIVGLFLGFCSGAGVGLLITERISRKKGGEKEAAWQAEIANANTEEKQYALAMKYFNLAYQGAERSFCVGGNSFT